MGIEMWTDKKKVKPWKFDRRREECDCSQYAPLRVSGYSEKQGPTHYCPICGWAFWSVLQRPTADQIILMKQTHPEANEFNMSYIRMCNKPLSPHNTPHTQKQVMIDQLGKLYPSFLTKSLREYWTDLYCEKYPYSPFAQRVEELRKEEERKYRK